ncbi:hypothetical protein LCGC14_1890230 [marine sediment metagenome]|uniref:Uncharacterized protein n=1 Tax=marine sediment metagenome TaxID=412755 RepID=A0A0F9FZY6_9ZZZZ
MSFEGYYHVLCKNGHLFTWDVYDSKSPFSLGPWDDSNEKNWKCRSCEEPMTWWELIDCTNDNGDPTELKIKTPPVQGYNCTECKHKCTSVNATYYIPKERGHLMT